MSKKKKKKSPGQKRGNSKTVKKISEKQSWRKFEELVSRIEKVLAPIGAIVTSPDFLVDGITGQRREVDATIRHKINGVKIVVLECRERVKMQDVLWIEQLVTKRQDLDISKTIAVSVNGFTEPAIKKAEHYGIELREISQIKEDIITKWGVTRTQINWKIVAWSISLDISNDVGEKVAQEIRKQYSGKENSKFLFSHKTNSSFSVRDLFVSHIEKTKGKSEEIVFSDAGESGIYKMDARINKGQIYIKTSIGDFDLIGLNAEFKFYKHEEITGKPIIDFTYSDTTKDIVKGIEFELASTSGKKELFTIHEKLLEEKTIATVWKDSDVKPASSKKNKN